MPTKRKRALPPHQDESESADAPRKFLPAPAVCKRYGVSDMTLFRWLRDPALGFPQPTMVLQGGRRYWDKSFCASGSCR